MGSSLSVVGTYEGIDTNSFYVPENEESDSTSPIIEAMQPKVIKPYKWFGKSLENVKNENYRGFLDLQDLEKKTGHRVYLIRDCTKSEINYYIHRLYINKITYCGNNVEKNSQNTISYIITARDDTLTTYESLVEYCTSIEDQVKIQGYNIRLLQKKILFFYEHIFFYNMNRDENIISMYRTLDDNFKKITLYPLIITLNCLEAFNIPSQVSIDKDLNVTINLPQTALSIDSLSIPPNAKFANVIHYEHAPLSCTTECKNYISCSKLLIVLMNPSSFTDVINFLEQLYIYQPHIFILSLHLPTLVINNTKKYKFIDHIINNFKYKSKKMSVDQEYIVYLFHHENFKILQQDCTILIDNYISIHFTAKSLDNIIDDTEITSGIDIIWNVHNDYFKINNTSKLKEHYEQDDDLFSIEFEKKILLYNIY